MNTNNQKPSHTATSPKAKDCVCESAFQDERYGKSMRLHNPMKEGKWCCTVCGRERE